MSPLALEMLCYFCTRAPEAGPFPNMGMAPQQEILARFLRDGIVDGRDGMARATDKGRAWLDLILQTPMPVKKWVDPRAESGSVQTYPAWALEKVDG